MLQVQLRWAGNVTRMELEDVRIPKAVFFSELQEGKRHRGAPRKRYKDQLKRHLARREGGGMGDQPSVIVAGGLRPRQLVVITEKGQW